MNKIRALVSKIRLYFVPFGLALIALTAGGLGVDSKIRTARLQSEIARIDAADRILVQKIKGQQARIDSMVRFGANVDHSTTTIVGGHAVATGTYAGFQSIADKVFEDALDHTTTDNALCRFDGTAGGTQNSTVIVSDTGAVGPIADGTASTDAAAFGQIAAAVNAQTFNGNVKVRAAANVGTLSGLAQTVDGVAINTDGDRVLADQQTTATQDACYVAHSGAWTICPEMATGSDAKHATFLAESGTQAGIWADTQTSAQVVGTNGLTFSQIGSGGGGAVSSVFTRTGAVVAASGDYTAAQVGAGSGVDVFAATTASLPAYTKAGTGVGATLTANANGAFPVLDSAVTLVANDPVKGLFLLQHGASAADAGVWMLTTQGSGGSAWVSTRYTGLDTAAEIVGSKLRIFSGVQHAGAEFIYVASATPTVDTTPLFWLRSALHGSNAEIAYIDEDCLSTIPVSGQQSSPGVVISNNGTGTTVAAATDNSANTIGAWKFTTGTTATSRTGLITSWGVASTTAGEGFSVAPATNVGLYYAARWSVNVLSTGTQEFAINAGFSDTTTLGNITPANGILFQYDRPTSTALQLITCAASTCTKTVGPTISAAAYMNTFLKKDAGTDLVRGWVDGVEIGTGQSTNVPTTVLLGAILSTFKSVGTTSVEAMHIDRMKAVITLPAGRGI